MSNLYPPFLKWGTCKSKDKENPDILDLEVADADTFETEYSVNARVLHKEENEWIEVNLPLHSFESKNIQLLELWTQATKQEKIKQGVRFKLLTWLGTSKNKFPIRRFELVF